MKFSRLRLSGFKSFVEPTDLLIEPGLTGVVGPNGCGKSNLLEALRWVMGESSYKSMRASGMDDVIFSGTTQRPARNMAEVVVTMENDDRSAPAQYNEHDTLEISRRIEREAGSAYRINGKDVRARDVQLLFADVSTGARSPALVRQGQIAEIINAKPQARRLILEEAAGITGLHTRRHEAELKLRAAEQNLTRLEDVTSQLETQLNSLKRQARQATKYKQISAEIRKLEAAGTLCGRGKMPPRLRRAMPQPSTRRRGCSPSTPARPPRSCATATNWARGCRACASRKPSVQRCCSASAHERNALDEEERRADQRRSELDQRMAQITADLSREQELLNDTGGVLRDAGRAKPRPCPPPRAPTPISAPKRQSRCSRRPKRSRARRKLPTRRRRALSELTARRNAILRAIEEQTARVRQARARTVRDRPAASARHCWRTTMSRATARNSLPPSRHAVAAAAEVGGRRGARPKPAARAARQAESRQPRRP